MHTPTHNDCSTQLYIIYYKMFKIWNVLVFFKTNYSIHICVCVCVCVCVCAPTPQKKMCKGLHAKGQSDHSTNFQYAFDLIILMAKFHIFKSKLQKGKPNVNIFIHSLNQRAAIEKYCIAASDQEERHETQQLSLAVCVCRWHKLLVCLICGFCISMGVLWVLFFILFQFRT